MKDIPKIKRPEAMTPKHQLTWAALSAAARLASYMFVDTPLDAVARQATLDAVQSGDLYRTMVIMSGVSQMAERRLIGTSVLHNEVDEWLHMTEDLILNDLHRKNKKPLTFFHVHRQLSHGESPSKLNR